jgi:tRNA(Ile)-lysidine synthase
MRLGLTISIDCCNSSGFARNAGMIDRRYARWGLTTVYLRPWIEFPARWRPAWQHGHDTNDRTAPILRRSRSTGESPIAAICSRSRYPTGFKFPRAAAVATTAFAPRSTLPDSTATIKKEIPILRGCRNRPMRTPLEQSVLQAIQHSGMLAPGDRVGVAVSGGTDSVALLRLLKRLRDNLGITLTVVHFNHTLRGVESEGDAEFVANLTRTLGLEIVIGREDVGAEARRQGRNLEDMARELRYAFFHRVVDERGATHIAVAHTADDQAETVLAHVIRGTGLTGLAGIYPVVGSVVRPLLGTCREDLREYLRAIGQSWREDSTNRDTQRMRARIRQQLLPLLARDFSPAIVSHLNELSRFAREEQSFWNALVEDRFQALVRREPDALNISVRALLSPLELQVRQRQDSTPAKCNDSLALRVLTERLIRRLYQGVRGNRRGLNANHVEQVIRLADECTGGRRTELPGGIIVQRNFQELTFSRAVAVRTAPSGTGDAASAYEYVVNLPLASATTISIPELGKCFRLKVIDWPIAESDTSRDANAIDADLLRPPLILRNWRPGDAYRPHGRRQEQKLRSMFVAGRVRSGDRAVWPVLESAGQVIWARGMPPAEEYCARTSTRRGVVIEERAAENAAAG